MRRTRRRKFDSSPISTKRAQAACGLGFVSFRVDDSLRLAGMRSQQLAVPRGMRAALWC
jgi:hypothetical protein